MTERRATAIVGLLGALFYAGVAWRAGQDANWDLQNYHDYAAYALLHWRYPLDVGAGSFQGYLNPLPYLLPYALRHALPPFPAALALAIVQSSVVIVAWKLAGSLLPEGTRWRGPLRVAATATGATGATVLSEVGTSFADLPLATLVLGSLAFLLRAGQRRPFLAGLLIGAATGLKLTNAVFAIALTAAAAVRTPPSLRGTKQSRATNSQAPSQTPPSQLPGTLTGMAAGFAIFGAPWAAYMWATLGNPIFPAMNHLFRSASAADSNYTDPRFLPRTLRSALAYPLELAQGLHPTAEVPFTEPRLLLAALAIAALAIAALACAGAAKFTAANLRNGDPRMARAATFLIVSTASWLGLFAIQRYAVAIETLSGVLLVTALPRLLPRSLAAPTALATAALTIAVTRPSDWWHRPWSDAFTPTPPAALLLPAAFAIVAHPVGYWASALPAGSRFYTVRDDVGLAPGGTLARQSAEGLAHPPDGTLWTLGYDYPMDEAARSGLSARGLVPAGPCVRARSLWWVDTVACHARATGPRPRAAADLPLATPADFSQRGSGWIYLGPGWKNAGPAGTAMEGTRSELVLHPPPAGEPLALDIETDGPPSGNRIELKLNGTQTAQFPSNGRPETRTLCLPPDLGPVASLEFAQQDRPGPVDLTLRTILLRPAQPGECPE